MAKYFDEAGNEVEAVPVEEVSELKTSLENKTKELEDLAAEKARLEAAGMDKDENFKSFRTKIEATEKELTEVKKNLSDKQEHERTTTKEALIKHFAGDDKEARERFEAKYKLFNTGETTPEEILERATEAAKLSGLYKEDGGTNPVFQRVFGGSAPFIKPSRVAEDDADNVVNTYKGKSALSAMGVPADYGTKK